MVPIRQLLNRVRWDRDFGSAVFVLGYYDRMADTIVRVELAAEDAVVVGGDGHEAIRLPGEDGLLHTVPLHRIREVFRDGLLIWQRPPAPGRP